MGGLIPPSAPEPRGTSPVGSPRRKPTGPPSATGARGRHSGHPRGDITGIIALILVFDVSLKKISSSSLLQRPCPIRRSLKRQDPYNNQEL